MNQINVPARARRWAVWLHAMKIVRIAGACSISLGHMGCGSCSRPLNDLCPVGDTSCNAEEQWRLIRCGEWASASGGESQWWWDLETGSLVGADLGSDTRTCGVYGNPPEDELCEDACTYNPRATTPYLPHCTEKPDWMSDAYYDGTATL